MSNLSYRQIHQILKREVKQVLLANSVNPTTRRGNKELSFILKRLAQQPYGALTEVSAVGQALGEQIVTISKQLGKKDLDGSVVRQIAAEFVPATPASSTSPSRTSCMLSSSV